LLRNFYKTRLVEDIFA